MSLLYLNIRKRLTTVDLQVHFEADSEIVALFGPSGAGKTQTLNAIAGLMKPDWGEISLEGEIFFRNYPSTKPVMLPARKRRIGYVFQNYALFPHMTALQNVLYPMRNQPDGQRRARELLERVRLSHVTSQYPAELSGGQQQRVAIARALAAKPKILLMDEPFSALDLPIRKQLHTDLRMLQEETNLLIVYVTHNLEDVFAIGHRLIILNQGQVEQIGTPQEVFQRPANRPVLELLGVPNLLKLQLVKINSAGLEVDWDGINLQAPIPTTISGMSERPINQLTAYLRPYDIRINRDSDHLEGVNQLQGRVIRAQNGPIYQTLSIALANYHELEVWINRVDSELHLSDVIPGKIVQVSFNKEAIFLI
ncbi:MAG TPA: ABC transporter ATP-binding protein [Chloroflexia bacterium]|nr:ABC transporter ATP-binding protein [Chloroflexia bacterium]